MQAVGSADVGADVAVACGGGSRERCAAFSERRAKAFGTAMAAAVAALPGGTCGRAGSLAAWCAPSL